MIALGREADGRFSLCWLWFVLRRRWWAYAAALTLGFFAVGLHQFHYHPLFAAPILFLLLLRKDWGRAAFYALGYLAIGLFWQGWTFWIAMLTVNGPLPADGSGGAHYLRRIFSVLDNAGDLRGNMIDNQIGRAAWRGRVWP